MCLEIDPDKRSEISEIKKKLKIIKGLHQNHNFGMLKDY